MSPRSPTWMVLAFLLIACTRPQSSPDYERARSLWNGLVQQLGEEASLDPRVDEILSLLVRVPKASLDALAADELRAHIAAERAALIEARAHREQLLAAVGAPLPMPQRTGEASGGGGGGTAPSGEKLPALVAGLKLEAFQVSYGACFEERGPVEISSSDGGARAGRMWGMKDDEACRQQHPRLVGQLVLFVDGVLNGVSPASALKKLEERQTVQVGTLPDGGLGLLVDGGVVPVPPGATLEVLDGGSR